MEYSAPLARIGFGSFGKLKVEVAAVDAGDETDTGVADGVGVTELVDVVVAHAVSGARNDTTRELRKRSFCKFILAPFFLRILLEKNWKLSDRY